MRWRLIHYLPQQLFFLSFFCPVAKLAGWRRTSGTDMNLSRQTGQHKRSYAHGVEHAVCGKGPFSNTLFIGGVNRPTGDTCQSNRNMPSHIVHMTEWEGISFIRSQQTFGALGMWHVFLYVPVSMNVFSFMRQHDIFVTVQH